MIVLPGRMSRCPTIDRPSKRKIRSFSWKNKPFLLTKKIYVTIKIDIEIPYYLMNTKCALKSSDHDLPSRSFRFSRDRIQPSSVHGSLFVHDDLRFCSNEVIDQTFFQLPRNLVEVDVDVTSVVGDAK